MSNSSGQRGHVLARILGWLRAGYPDGVPPQDRVVLLGLLHRRLTDHEVELVAHTLASEGTIDASDEEIADVVRRAVHEAPDEREINRVRGRLAAAGWPLADPGELGGEDPDVTETA